MASRNASFGKTGFSGVLLAPLKWLALGVMLLLGLLVAGWVINGVFVFQVWPEGISRLQDILEEEFARTIQLPCWCGDLQPRAVATANFLYSLIFRMTGIHDMSVSFASGSALSIPDTIVREGYLANHAEIHIAMLSTQLFGVRLGTLILVLPPAALVYGVALVDGLVQRAIRRACGGRESSSIYHRAKHLQLVLLVASIAIYLLWVSSTELFPFWGILLLIIAILVRIQWSYYKKHL